MSTTTTIPDRSLNTSTDTPSSNDTSSATTPSTHDVVEVPRSDLVTVKDTDYHTDKHLILCGKCRGVLNASSYSCVCEHDSDAARAA